MSTPHRATAEEWAEISAAASNPSGEACSAIVELRARVEALEAAQQPAVKDSLTTAPAGSLLERVSHAIDQAAGDSPNTYEPEARAAIREVLAHIKGQWFVSAAEVVEELAAELRQEADRP